MNWRQHIPKSWRLVYQLARRRFKDQQTGIYGRLASAKSRSTNTSWAQIKVVQDIKPSHLFQNKIHNLKLASDKISQVLIYPDQVFSYWYLVGRPVAKNGFKKGRNLIGGRLQEDYGGGLCQLSGLLYHLCLLGGLKIVERHAHSLDIYQEEERYTPLGADATVVYGYKDFRFCNTLDHPVAFSFQISDEKIIGQLCCEEPIQIRELRFERNLKEGGELVRTQYKWKDIWLDIDQSFYKKSES